MTSALVVFVLPALLVVVPDALLRFLLG